MSTEAPNCGLPGGVTRGGVGDRWSEVLPQGVRDVVGRRLDRLSADTNEVLTTAAVIGRDFSLALLERITDGAGSKSILFKTFPAFTSPGKPPALSGNMLTEDWQRVGHPPFNFLKS